jgi:signal transduction histidine kinase/ActR/RegA family two-component response regulator
MLSPGSETKALHVRSETNRMAGDVVPGPGFFHELPLLLALEGLLGPEFLDRHPDGVRAWVAGCGTGEDAYTLAMLLRERADEAALCERVQVFATETDDAVLEVAREGRYPGSTRAQVNPARLTRFFTASRDGYTVRKGLRVLCTFAKHDLDADPPFSRMDLVYCSRLPLPLDPTPRRRFLEILHYALRQGGLLLLGGSPRLTPTDLELFEVVVPPHRILRRREVACPFPIPLPRRRASDVARAPRSGGEARDLLEARNEELQTSAEELRSMNEELAALNGRLDGKVATLERLNGELQREVSVRERAERALHEADHRKEEFLAVLSHELRNPLAPIRTSLHVLELGLGGGEASRAMQIMSRQVGHLERLVNDLLDVTRVTHGKLQVDMQPLELGRLAHRAAEDGRSFFSTRGLALDVTLPSAPVWVRGDATRLAQVLGNLLQNAAKFSKAGGRVQLSLDAVDGAAVLEVRDDGLGIEPELLARVFEPFVQADTSLDRRLGGLGLGLALVKGLVEMHGGTVALSSAGKGAGTSAVVRLPVVSAPAPHETAPRLPAVGSRKILVIEDNVDAADSLRLALELEGHHVEVAHDGPRGIARASAVAPDVVLCDIGLPQMDGYTVARALREDPRTRGALLVALSGYGTEDDQRRAAEAGFDAHMTKPGSIEKLQEIVARALPALRAVPPQPAG